MIASPSFQDRVDSTAQVMRLSALAAGMQMTGDGRVSEADAAKLLSYSPDRLKHMRHEGTAPAAFKIGLNGCRLSYRVIDLATWIEQRREEF